MNHVSQRTTKNRKKRFFNTSKKRTSLCAILYENKLPSFRKTEIRKSTAFIPYLLPDGAENTRIARCGLYIHIPRAVESGNRKEKACGGR